MLDLAQYAKDVAQNARQASTSLATITGDQKLNWLRICAQQLVSRTSEIVEQNSIDIAAGEAKQLSSAMLDRLRLTP